MAHFTPKPGFPAVIKSSRDTGKEGYRGCSPWAKNGIFIQGAGRAGQSESTPESIPGCRPDRRNKIENQKSLKTIHEFDGGGTFVCIHCVMMKEGHDKLMAKLKAEQDAVNKS